MTHLTGRVFSRLQQYDALPTELKREVEALEKHLTATQRDVFSSHPTLKLKTVHGVKTDALLEKIDAWYKLHGKEFSQTHSHGVGHGHGHGHHGATTAPGTATGKAHNAAHNVKEDVKHAAGRDRTYDQNYDQTQTRGYTGTGDHMGRNYDGTGHVVTNDPNHGKAHNAAHNVKEDVKQAMGRDHTHDPNYDQTQTRGYAGTGADMGPNYDGTGHVVTNDPHHGKAHGLAHDVKEDVKYAMGRDKTYDPNYDQTRGNYDTATGAPTSASHTAGTTGTAAGAGAMTGAGAATHQTTPNTIGAHSTNPNVGNYQVGGSATPATAPVQPVQQSHMHGATGGVHSPHVKELLDALVLKGFVTPHKEPKPEDAGVATPSKPGAPIGGTAKAGILPKDLEIYSNTLLVARAPSIADEKMKEKGPSVWDVVDGAVFAGMVNRKAGLIEKVIHGKETYVVVNERLHSLTLFKSDVSRKSITQLFNRGLQVAFDDSHAEHGQSHGVKVWNGADSEVLFTTTQQERDALARALVQIGASQNGVRGIGIDGATPATGMKGKAEKMGHDVKHAVGADRPHHHDATTAGQPYNQSYNTDKHVGEGIMGGEHRGHYAPTDTRSATHTARGDAMHGDPQYQQPSHHHGMEKLGLGDHHHHHQQYQQNPQYGMTADNAHVKRDVGESRGYTQVNEPTVAP